MKTAFAFALCVGDASQHIRANRHHHVRSTNPALDPVRHKPAPSEIQELKEAVAAQKDAIAAQQQQIQQMQQQIQSRDQAIQTLQQRVGHADSAASQAQQAAQSALAGEQKEGQITSSDFSVLQHDVTDLKASSASTVESLTATEKRVGEFESPMAIHFKGITLTPGGFVAADTVWRSHAMYSDTGTQFIAMPFSASGQARSLGLIRYRDALRACRCWRRVTWATPF